MRPWTILAGVIVALGVLSASPTFAQPATPPGTICVIPGGWCWAISPGISGQPCQCPTNSGWISGIYN
jgi:hypothetical protein